MFCWYKRPHGFLVQGYRGGVYQNLRFWCTTATFRYLSHSAVVIPCESARPWRTGEKEGDESDPPPKWGGHAALDSWHLYHASIRPHAGSLSSSFIPAGRLGTAPQEGR